MNVSADGAVPTASGTSRLLAWTVTWRPSPSTAWRKRISKPTSAQGTTFDDAGFHTRTPVAPILDESLFASAEYARSRQAAAPTSAAAAWRCTPKYRSIRRTLSSFDFKTPSKLHVARHQSESRRASIRIGIPRPASVSRPPPPLRRARAVEPTLLKVLRVAISLHETPSAGGQRCPATTY